MKCVGFELDGIVQDRGEPSLCVFVYDAVNSRALHGPGKRPRLLTLRLPFSPVKLDRPGSWQDPKWTGRGRAGCYSI